MKFATQYEKNPTQTEKTGGKRLVETQGYISNNDRITNLMLAGVRLRESRTPKFDFDGVPIPDGDGNWDPTRRRNYDIADASQELRELDARIAQTKKDVEDRERALQSAGARDQQADDMARLAKQRAVQQSAAAVATAQKEENE